jgi:hypothetical protein
MKNGLLIFYGHNYKPWVTHVCDSWSAIKLMQLFNKDGYKQRRSALMPALRTMVNVHMQQRRQEKFLCPDHEAHKHSGVQMCIYGLCSKAFSWGCTTYAAVSGTSNQQNLAAENSGSLSF